MHIKCTAGNSAMSFGQGLQAPRGGIKNRFLHSVQNDGLAVESATYLRRPGSLHRIRLRIFAALRFEEGEHIREFEAALIALGALMG